jgi:hypothetical protein
MHAQFMKGQLKATPNSNVLYAVMKYYSFHIAQALEQTNQFVPS